MSLFPFGFKYLFIKMRLSTITLIGVAIKLVLTNHIKLSSEQPNSNLHEANLHSPSSQRPHLKDKPDYSLALEHVKAAIDSYHRSSVNHPDIDLVTGPTDHTVSTFSVSDLPKRNTEPVEGAHAKETPPVIEKGKTYIPPGADVEEDDFYDPEEDPDDMDDPPIVNGVVVNREE